MKNELFQKLINQINFILVKFNFTSEQFADEINYLLTNYENPSFNLSSFTDKLLTRTQHLLILENWTTEPPYFTNEQQVQALQRLLRILDLNDWLELVRKINPTNYDSWPYQLTREQTTSQLQQLIRRIKPTHLSFFNSREEPDLPPVRTFTKFNRDFYCLSKQPFGWDRNRPPSLRNSCFTH